MNNKAKNNAFECPELVSIAAAATIIWSVLTAVTTVYGAAFLSMSNNRLTSSGHTNSMTPAAYWLALAATVILVNGSGILFSVYALRGRMWAYLCACLWLLLNLFIEAFPIAAGKYHEILWTHIVLVVLALAFWLVPIGQYQMFTRNRIISGGQPGGASKD